ncbi:two-component system regulatory protein YycI [Bacillus timonensis]|nr:two-component system regulatory protein YycI [Bacillus timonensis]
MDWNKTKTIFIITFLVLDLFLGYQFIEKRNSRQLDIITEASIDEKFEAEEITYVELPKVQKEGTYISGKPKLFTSEDAKLLEKQQIINLENPAILQSILKEPYKLSKENLKMRLNQFLKENVLQGESYVLWKIDEQTGTLALFQTYKGKTFYSIPNNISAMLLININEEYEIISYKQTMLVDIVEEYDKEEILPAIKALENLYKNDYLKSGSDVTKVELGYYPLVQLSDSQVLTPTWHIIVDNKVDFYVNAFEGQIIEILE